MYDIIVSHERGYVMAYYLTVEKGRINGREDYDKLDITKANCFTRLSKTLKGDGCTLEEIDTLTTQFRNENELREYLILNGILPLDYMDKKLTLRQQLNGSLKKVRHDFLYQKDIEYIADVSRLIKKINDKLWVEKDLRFVESFANNYLTFRDCTSTAADVRYAAGESIVIGQISKMFSQYDENVDDLLTRMVKLLIYEYNQSRDGKVHYSGKIKYRNLHSIIAFINNYDKKYNVVLDDGVVNESMKTTEAIIPQNEKIRTLSLNPKMGSKKYTLDDQLSLFDKK